METEFTKFCSRGWVHFEGHVIAKDKKDFLFDRIHGWYMDETGNMVDGNEYQVKINSRPLDNASVKPGDYVLFDGIVENEKDPRITKVDVIGRLGSKFQSDEENVKSGKPLLGCECTYKFKCDMFSCPFC